MPVKNCGAKKTQGGICQQPAGLGTDHLGHGRCKFHGGATPNGEKHGAKAELNAMAERLPVTPSEAVVGTLELVAGQLAYATLKVGELPEDKMFVNTIQGKVPHHWIQMQGTLQERIVKFAGAAASMGVAERKVDLLEAQTKMMGELLEGVMKDVGLSAAQRKKVGPAIRNNLALIEGSAREAAAA
jgi:hypothetical protein